MIETFVMSGNAILALPAYKVLLSQLKNADTVQNCKVKYCQWDVLFCNQTKHEVTNVWIQGFVVPYKPKGNYSLDDELLISDGTGCCLLVGLSKIPKIKETAQFKPGNRVLVIGYVLYAGKGIGDTKRQYGNDEIIAKLKAIKLTEVSKNVNCVLGKEWKNEVFAAQGAVLESLTYS